MSYPIRLWIAGAALLAGCTRLLDGNDVANAGADASAPLDAAPDSADGASGKADANTAADAGTDANTPADASLDSNVPADAATDAAAPSDAAPDAPDAPDAAGNVPIAISAGGYSTCVVLANGQVYCWGWNENGQIGNGTAPGDTVAQATLVAADTHGNPFGDIVQIALGASHACALKRNGDLYCWGLGDSGEVGDSVAPHNVLSPQKVSAVSGYTAIAGGVGGYTTCALDATSHVYCWGSNYKSDLGHDEGTNGDVTQPNNGSQANATPVAVEGLGRTTALALGAYFTCAIDDAGVGCWGEDQDGDPGVQDGELGDLGAAGDNSPVPLRVTTPGAMKYLGAGQSFACAWGDATGATCWGSNEYGELASGEFTSPLGPTPLALGDASVVEMKGSYGTLLALTSDRMVWAAGYNGDGELANGTVAQGQGCAVDNGLVPGGQACVPFASPTLTPSGIGTLKAVHIAAGFRHACAIGEDHAVYCWGDNTYGQLGGGATGDPRGLPISVVGLPAPF